MFKFLKDDDETATATDGSSTDDQFGPDMTLPSDVVLPAEEEVVSERHYNFVRPGHVTGQDKQQQHVGLGPYSSVIVNPLRGKTKTEVEIKYIQIGTLANHPQVDDKIKQMLRSTSDLVPSVYEGGFKVWECTLDLITYLENHEDLYQFGENTKVLDVGCGSGLLGLYAMSRGSIVHFQDYNPEVLHHLTIPNVLINYGDQDEVVAGCRFFSGDWGSLRKDLMTTDKIDEFRYDYILTSETTYNLQSLSKLYSLMKHCLKPNGRVLLASKTCYFGVGGGTQSFLRHVELDGAMRAETVCVISEGVQREIILLKFKP